MTTTDVKELAKATQSEPADAAVRLALADALEEAGDNDAAGCERKVAGILALAGTLPVSIGDPRVPEFLELWHENGRRYFEKCYQNLDYDSAYYGKTAKDRSKYIALDSGTSGVFLLEKATGEVFRIKGYGVPNRKKCVGTLDRLIAAYREANEKATQLGHDRY
jgi:uncharacterized protein (TIGR02996 family)